MCLGSLCGDDGGSDQPSAPDYGPVAEATKYAATLAKQTADADLAFRQKVYGEAMPMISKLATTSQDVATQQLADMRESSQRADQQWQHYTDTFMPIEQRMAEEAMAYGGEADQERRAGQAIADVNSQFTNARGQMDRNLESMGVNPNSGRFASGERSMAIMEGAAAAGAATGARETARDQGISLRAGAAAFGRNMPNTAGQFVGIANASGNSAVANTATGANGGLPWAQFTAGGYDNGLRAAQIQQTGAINLGNIQSRDYATNMSSYTTMNKDEGSGLGSLIGTGLSMFGGAMGWLADGGEIQGPGTGISDSVPAVNTDTGQRLQVSNGEYVLPADTVRAIGKQALDRIIQATHIPARMQRQAVRR